MKAIKINTLSSDEIVAITMCRTICRDATERQILDSPNIAWTRLRVGDGRQPIENGVCVDDPNIAKTIVKSLPGLYDRRIRTELAALCRICNRLKKQLPKDVEKGENE